MQCFEFAEHPEPGILIARYPEPHVPLKGHAPLLLDPKLADLIKQIPKQVEGNLLLHEALLLFKSNTVRLEPPPPEWKDTRALVHVTTGTVGGVIELHANCFVEALHDGQVTKTWLPFPPAGVHVALGTPVPIAAEDGAVMLEMLLILDEGASFRITRTGDLQDTSPEIFVQWRGGRLLARVPHRFRDMHRHASDQPVLRKGVRQKRTASRNK